MSDGSADGEPQQAPVSSEEEEEEEEEDVPVKRRKVFMGKALFEVSLRVLLHFLRAMMMYLSLQ